MGSKLKDILGKRFGRLVVVGNAGKNKDGRYYWDCLCDCGKSVVVSGTHLRRKQGTFSCGCIRKIDDTGKRYNRLTAIKPKSKNNHSEWWYICDCGTVKTIIASHVRSGAIVSCGCYNIEKSSGVNNKRWNGGRAICSNGYVKVLKDDHKSYDTNKRYILEHRSVIEKHIGRSLLPHENIHHKNGIKDDNRIENLEVWSSSQPQGQRVEDKIEWALNFLTEQGIIKDGIVSRKKPD